MVVVTSNLKDHLAKYTTITVAMLRSQEAIEPEQERFFLTLKEAKSSGDCRAESVGRFDIPEMVLDEKALELGIIQTELDPIGHLTVTSGLTGIATSPLKPLYTLLPNPDLRSLSFFSTCLKENNNNDLYKIDEQKYLFKTEKESYFIDLEGTLDDTRFLYKDSFHLFQSGSYEQISQIVRGLKEGQYEFASNTVKEVYSKHATFEEANPDFLSELKRLYGDTY